MFRSALATILLNGGSTVLSFLNQLLIAASFGASATLDAYFVGISVPMAVAANLNQMLVYAIMPVLVGAVRTGRGASLTSAFGVAYVGLAVALAGLGLVFGPAILAGLGGIRGASDLATARFAFALFALTGATIVVSGLLTAIANTERSFVWPILSGYGLPLGTLVGILLLRDRLGPPAIAVGALVGSTLGLALLATVLRRRFAAPPYAAADWVAVRATLARSPVYLLGMLPFSALAISDSFWGTRLGPSVVSHLGYSNRILVNLAGVLMMGPVAVLAQRLSEHHAGEDAGAFRRAYAQGVRILLWFGGYLSAMLFVLAEPAVRILFQHGRFGPEDTRAVAGLLRIMGLGLMGTNCAVLSFSALYARRQGAVAAVLGTTLCLAYFALSGGLGAAIGATGVAWAYSITWWTFALLAMAVVSRGGLLSPPVVGEAARLAATLAFAVLASGLTNAALGVLGASRIADALRVGLAGAVGGLAFGLLAVGAFRNREVTGLLRRLRLLRPEAAA